MSNNTSNMTTHDTVDPQVDLVTQGVPTTVDATASTDLTDSREPASTVLVPQGDDQQFANFDATPASPGNTVDSQVDLVTQGVVPDNNDAPLASSHLTVSSGITSAVSVTEGDVVSSGSPLSPSESIEPTANPNLKEVLQLQLPCPEIAHKQEVRRKNSGSYHVRATSATRSRRSSTSSQDNPKSESDANADTQLSQGVAAPDDDNKSASDAEDDFFQPGSDHDEFDIDDQPTRIIEADFPLPKHQQAINAQLDPFKHTSTTYDADYAAEAAKQEQEERAYQAVNNQPSSSKSPKFEDVVNGRWVVSRREFRARGRWLKSNRELFMSRDESIDPQDYRRKLAEFRAWLDPHPETCRRKFYHEEAVIHNPDLPTMYEDWVVGTKWEGSRERFNEIQHQLDSWADDHPEPHWLNDMIDFDLLKQRLECWIEKKSAPIDDDVSNDDHSQSGGDDPTYGSDPGDHHELDSKETKPVLPYPILCALSINGKKITQVRGGFAEFRKFDAAVHAKVHFDVQDPSLRQHLTIHLKCRRQKNSPGTKRSNMINPSNQDNHRMFIEMQGKHVVHFSHRIPTKMDDIPPEFGISPDYNLSGVRLVSFEAIECTIQNSPTPPLLTKRMEDLLNGVIDDIRSVDMKATPVKFVLLVKKLSSGTTNILVSEFARLLQYSHGDHGINDGLNPRFQQLSTRNFLGMGNIKPFERDVQRRCDYCPPTNHKKWKCEYRPCDFCPPTPGGGMHLLKFCLKKIQSIECNKCHERGHLSRDCTSQNKVLKCFRCRKFGHTELKCMPYMSGKQMAAIQQARLQFAAATPGQYSPENLPRGLKSSKVSTKTQTQDQTLDTQAEISESQVENTSTNNQTFVNSHGGQSEGAWSFENTPAGQFVEPEGDWDKVQNTFRAEGGGNSW